MKEKIINIRNVLKIIISIFVIFSFVKSCAKAYTFEEFLDYCEYIKPIIAQDLGTSSEQYIMCTRIVDNKDTIIQQIGNQLDLTKYDGWIANGTNTTHYIRFWGTKNVSSLQINQNGSANVGQYVGKFCANYNANKSNWLARRC